MYFPHAFKKSYYASSTTLRTSGATKDLTAGQIGFFKASDYTALSAGSIAPFIFAQGSWYASDKIGPVHGGYKESVKSKVINPKYISRVVKVSAKTAKQQIVKVDAAACAGLTCDTTFRLRLDVKGAPALRFLNHQLYKTLDGYTGCCDATNSAVDQTVVLLKWADQINEAPLLKDFVQAKVWKEVYTGVAIDPTAASATIKVADADASKFAAGDKVVAAGIPANTTVVSVGAAGSGGGSTTNVVLTQAATSSTNVNASVFSPLASATYTPATSSLGNVNTHMDLIGAYVDTTFGNCTFTPTDNYNLEPIFIYASAVDESGDPCATSCFAVSETQAPVQVSGLGETVLRDLILDSRYRQEAYPDSSRVESLRMREIEANPVFSEITRSSLYDQVLILHNVPRFNNPTSTFDNDQYLICINVPTGTSTDSITDFLIAAADAAQGTDAVNVETY